MVEGSLGACDTLDLHRLPVVLRRPAGAAFAERALRDRASEAIKVVSPSSIAVARSVPAGTRRGTRRTVPYRPTAAGVRRTARTRAPNGPRRDIVPRGRRRAHRERPAHRSAEASAR
ncbi:hypothetical protein CW362_09540 [Streptomyces populi]|uniref:Uncharacterized protein n=1 Tax=Streptomyces populi TaxID=2058924 RepID=A0A2I0STC7_9ACTN|nr:hypothetical protein CW362_09540 [Streptomyces populi]